MNVAYQRSSYVTAVALLGVCGFFFILQSPLGISALPSQFQQIRQLEGENAALRRDNDYKRERIRKLNQTTLPGSLGGNIAATLEVRSGPDSRDGSVRGGR